MELPNRSAQMVFTVLAAVACTGMQRHFVISALAAVSLEQREKAPALHVQLEQPGVKSPARSLKRLVAKR